MALVTTTFEVLAVLAAMAGLLWFSSFVEARQLGPVIEGGRTDGRDHPEGCDAPAGGPALAQVDGLVQLAEVGQAA